MIVLQKINMLLLNPFTKYTGRLQDKSRNLFVYICCALLVCVQLVWFVVPVLEMREISQRTEAIVAAIIFIVLIIFSTKTKLRQVTYKKRFTILYALCFILIALAQIDHPIGDGFLESALMALLIFPVLYFVWGNRKDYDTLYKLFAKACSHALFIYFIISLVFFPINIGQRYMAMTLNPNILGMLCVACAMCSLYLIMEEHYMKGWFYLLPLGAAIFCAMYSQSRTALIVITFQIVIFIFYYIRHKVLKYKGIINIIILLAVLFIIITSVAIVPYSINYIHTINTTEKTVEKEKTVQGKDEQIEKQPSKTFERLESKRTGNITQLSSGRTTVWKNYLDQLNLKGHDGRQLLFIGDGYNDREWAHNTALEIAYRCGTIPGAIFLLIEIFAGICMLIWLFNKKHESWRLFSIMGICAFCVYSVLEVVLFPFEHIIVLLFFLSIMPIFIKIIPLKEKIAIETRRKE